ncbi:hypothetical protein M0R45_026793 [Rubus argutus]|uniref:Uncharacterized protein n=1 Tax=Rubus argutus TaxID=59490 RepID=A0AAW1WY58_RUBAR
MGREERTPLEFEPLKEKKKHKVKGKNKAKKDELDRNSSVVEVCGAKMGKVVEGPKYDKSGGIHVNSGEGANKKKKRKMVKEGEDIPIENMINTNELRNNGEKSNRKTMEEVDSTGNAKKRKKILEDGKMGVAIEHGDVAQMNEGGDKKKINKKEKREKAGGEMVQNVTSDGMEAGVASQRLDGHIVEKGGFALEERKKEKKIVERIPEVNCRNLWLKKWAPGAVKFKKTCS